MVLGLNVASAVPSRCMSSVVLCICFVSGIPSTEWTLVHLKISPEFVGWDMELRGSIVVGSALGGVSWP